MFTYIQGNTFIGILNLLLFTMSRFGFIWKWIKFGYVNTTPVNNKYVYYQVLEKHALILKEIFIAKYNKK